MAKPKVYTPVQIAEILQINKNTVYELINRGEIVAKRLGKVYRIPAQSISFAFSGLDSDILEAQKQDLSQINEVNEAIQSVRAEK
jgi:excisionase family DNA binding protein